MKQVTQRLRDGQIEVVDVPAPTLTPETVLVEVHTSLLSSGTERTKVETGRKSLVGKARSRPDQVRKVVEKVRRDGLAETVDAVRIELDAPRGLGYSAAGVVAAVGDRVPDLTAGDRVACGGAGAMHSEIDRVPGNLCARIPDALSFEQAAFATVGSVALHSVRQAEAVIGGRIAVIGLGLVGQLVGQLLRAAGSQAIGVDLAPGRVEQARALGAVHEAFARDELDEPLPRAAADCDAVIVTAATSSSDPLELAAALCRDRGRVVVVGDVGMTIPRLPYYEKELELRLSRSYGPGRYDRAYEEHGLDYPIGYVRWTERRNMRAFLDLVARGHVDVRALVTERLPIEQAATAYDHLLEPKRLSLGIVLEYPPSAERRDPRRPVTPAPTATAGDAASAGVIGAGSFAGRVLIPALRDAGFHLRLVASANGLSAKAAAVRFGFESAVTPDEVLADKSVGLVVIATRHDSHAALAANALRLGKHVFVEKPPALTMRELRVLRAARDAAERTLAVGFNRRYAPLASELRKHVVAAGAPIRLLYRVNAEPVTGEHWLDDLEEGGGRLVGEGCHFVDFACWVVGRLPAQVVCLADSPPGRPLPATRSFNVSFIFPDGSTAALIYSDAGADGLGKEYVEAHAAGRSAVLDDFKSLTLLDGKRRRRSRSRTRDKGHRGEFVALRAALKGERPLEEPDALDTMTATFAALRSALTGRAVSLEEFLKENDESG